MREKTRTQVSTRSPREKEGHRRPSRASASFRPGKQPTKYLTVTVVAQPQRAPALGRRGGAWRLGRPVVHIRHAIFANGRVWLQGGLEDTIRPFGKKLILVNQLDGLWKNKDAVSSLKPKGVKRCSRSLRAG